VDKQIKLRVFNSNMAPDPSIPANLLKILKDAMYFSFMTTYSDMDTFFKN
jgi:hypothetical protein